MRRFVYQFLLLLPATAAFVAFEQGGQGSVSDAAPAPPAPPASPPGDAGSAVLDAAPERPPPAPDAAASDASSAFTTVQIQGNANLNAGNIAGAGSGDTSSSIGVYAATGWGFSIIAAFSFGSKGSSITAKS